MQEIIFWTIIIIITGEYLFESYLDYLNIRNMGTNIPGELSDVYNKEEYARQQSYQRENHRFGMIAGMVGFAGILIMIGLYGFAFVDSLVWQITSSPIVAALMFFGIIMLASHILQLPFSIYSTFVIEEKYGFNKTTPRTFIKDEIKGLLLGAIIGGGILALIVFIYQKTQDMFWVYAWALIALISLFMTMFYSSLIVPMFNRQTPLEAGPLRKAIQEFAEKANFKLDNVFVIDGSKRSSKANAYFTGFGSKKRIVLYDTLIEEMEIDEIVAVLAHEIGHYKRKHVIQGLAISLLHSGVLLFVFSLLIDNPWLSQALGVEEPNFHIGLIAFGILYTPVSFVLGILMNNLSRRNEYQADAFAAVHYKPQPLSDGLKKLSQKNLSNLTPHPLYVYFNYSHPPLLNRIQHLNKFKKSES